MRQHRLYIRRRTEPGATPGTIVSDPAAPPPRIWFVRFNRNELEEGELHSLEELAGLRAHGCTLWVNVDGLGNAEQLRALAESLKLHPLAVEDVVNTHQRPKVEEYDDHIYIACRTMRAEQSGSEQLSLFLWSDMVLTFREQASNSFDPLLTRIRQSHGRVRVLAADYLAYSILDVLVDAFFPLLDAMDEQLESLEADVLQDAVPETLTRIHDLKHRLAAVRRIVSPTREVANALIRDAGGLISDASRVYLRDVYDHTVQILELVENQREIVASLLEIYLSSVSNRMNQVMKVLAIIATLFIPLTFLVGLYGMNFDTTSPWNMPELHWRFGYPFAWLIMIVLVVLELFLFRRMGWIGKKKRGSR
jgi:magnesium transporter